MMPPIPAVPIHSHHHQREHHHHHHQEEPRQQYHQYNRPSQPTSIQWSPSSAAPVSVAAPPSPPSRAATSPRVPEGSSASSKDADVVPPHEASAVTLPNPVQAVPGLTVLPGVPGSKDCCVWSAILRDWPEECGRDAVATQSI